ncbi:MAG: tetratricopeptide repeat protein [candidate division Zixibacteria bacterium]|nr:tetratricopeptide repeat protein [candidate division Zixibacteria bacterium]
MRRNGQQRKPGNSPTRNDLFLAIVIFGLAFAVKLIYLAQIESSLPFFSTPTLDELYHDTWAQQIASGDWAGNEPFFRAPLYVYLLALMYKVFGHSLLLPRLFQMVLGSLSCVLVFFIAKKLFNGTVAILSAIMACFYAMLIFYDLQLLITSLLVFVDLVIIGLLIRAGEKPKSLNWLLCGLVLGLSAIARPNILAFVPFILIWMFFQFKTALRTRAILTRWAILCAGVLLMIAPVGLRNYLVGKDLVLIAWQGGMNFYLGNNPDATGYTAASASIGRDLTGGIERTRTVAEQEVGRKLKPSEISGFWYKKGVDFILSQPLDWLKLMGKKTVYFWKGYEISNTQNVYTHKEFSPLFDLLLGSGVVYLPFGLIGPLSIMGLLVSLKNPRKYLLLYLFILSYSASIIVFFVCSRFRMPVIPLLLMFSSFFLWWLFRKIKSKQSTSVLISLCAVAILVVVLNTRLENLVGDQRFADHYSLGASYQQLGRWDEAIQEYRTSLEFRPNFAHAHHGLAYVYEKLDKIDLAIQEYGNAIRGDPPFESSYNNLGVLYHKRGEIDKAIELYSEAIRLNQGYEEARINLGIAYSDKGMANKAREQWKKVLQINPTNKAALTLLKRR